MLIINSFCKDSECALTKKANKSGVVFFIVKTAEMWGEIVSPMKDKNVYFIHNA